MYEDEPSDKVHDVLAGAVFGDHPLGRPIIGSADVVGSVPVPDIAAYHDSRYVGSNLVLAAAGNLEHEQVVAQAERLLGRSQRSRLERLRAGRVRRRPPSRFHTKDTEQYHLALGGPGLARGDDRRFALRVLDTLLGGSSSSRLFQEVREKRGLAYAVYSYASSFVDIGQVGVYVGTRPRQRGRGDGDHRRPAAPARGRRRPRRGARAGQGERQGPHRALDGVHAGPHEPPRQLGADGRPDSQPGRAAGQDRRRDRRGRGRARRASAYGPTRCRPPAWAPTRRSSARGSTGAPSWPRRDLGSGLGRRGAHGPDRVRRGRGRRGHEPDRPRGPVAGHLAGRRAGRRRGGGGLHHPRHRAGQRARVPRGRRALRGGHHRRRPHRAGGGRHRQPLLRAELRHRRGADDGGGEAGRPAHARVRDHRAAPPGQAGRPVRHRDPHGPADRGGGRERARADSLGPPARAGGLPGGHLRGRGPDPDHPSRHHLARVVHAWGIARG